MMFTIPFRILKSKNKLLPENILTRSQIKYFVLQDTYYTTESGMGKRFFQLFVIF